MAVIIEPPIADIQPSDEPYPLIDDHYLLMVAPQERDHYKGWVPEDFDVGMQGLQIVFGVL